jgi:prepilin-type N-terminal cleavage/methylation domain-containing protein
MKKINKKDINNKGFTILETLVAISILVIAITATFTAAQSGLSSATESRDQVRAFYLAQEAIEMVRNTRDSNSLLRITAPATSWLTGLASQASDPCYFGKSCTVDAVTKTFTACASPGSCANLNEDLTVADSKYGMYGYDVTWTPTNFNRQIDIVQTAGITGEVSVTVTMKWKVGPATRTFVVNEVLRDWQ